MGEPHVIPRYALNAPTSRGASMPSKITQSERLRASLAHIDAIPPLFSTDDAPDILERPLHRRSRCFALSEVLKRCRDALRAATAPMSSLEIAEAVTKAKGVRPMTCRCGATSPIACCPSCRGW